MHVRVACRTPQFWLLWMVLWLNVTAGIGILGMASPMLQEIFAGKLLSLDLSWHELNGEQLKRIATMAAGFTGLLSLFNIWDVFLGIGIRPVRTQNDLCDHFSARGPCCTARCRW